MTRIKYIFLSLYFFLAFCASITAQEVSISFSIDDNGISSKDTLNPYLVISYHNSGSTPYYFQALSYSGHTVPIFSMSTFWGTNLPKISRDETIALLHQYHNLSFTLSLEFLEAKNGEMWSLYQDNDYGENWSFIEACLCQYYRPFYTNHEDYAFYTDDDIKRVRTLRKSRALVFLKAGQTKEQRISLRGMKEAGIKLTIRLENNVAPNTFCVTLPSGPPYFRDVELPPNVFGYSLYRGYFISSEFKIDFSNNQMQN